MNALAAALVHAIWQGAALAILVAALSSLLTSARARSGVALAGLAALLVAPPASAILMLRAGSADVATPVARVAIPGAAVLEAAVDTGTRVLLDGAAVASGSLVAIWAAGAALLLARLCVGLLGARRLRRQGTPAHADLRAAVARAARRLGVRRPITVLESGRIDVPAALGGRRPTVLIPSALGGVPSPDLDAVLAHEVAHLRRSDWEINLAQAVADAVLWFHPAAWWLSARARREREFACDDLAAGSAVERVRLARALTALESGRVDARLALSSTAGPLLRRVARLLPGTRRRPGRSGRGAIRWAALLAAFAIATAAAWATIVVLPASARATAGPASTLTARDDAGSFTISFRGDRVVGATVDGRAVPMARLRQTPDSLYFLAADGAVDFGVRVKPNAAGITWRSRTPAPAL